MVDLNDFICGDCMKYLPLFPYQFFELAIVDPVYGDVKAGGYIMGKSERGVAAFPEYNFSIWQQEKITKAYFDELFRVSKKSDYLWR